MSFLPIVKAVWSKCTTVRHWVALCAADALPADTGIRALAPPVEVGPMVEAMWWHPVFDDDPEHGYLRDLVARAAAQVVDGAV